MKIVKMFLLIMFSAICVSAANPNDVLTFKSKIGFVNSEDQIVEFMFYENGKKVLFIGEKYLQIWDVKNAKLVNSAPHNIPQFVNQGFFKNYVLLGLPRALNYKPYSIDPKGKWIITIEATVNKDVKTVIVRDLQNVKQIATLDLPDVTTENIAIDELEGEIVTFGRQQKKASFAYWNIKTFKLKKVITIEDYKWSELIRGDEKIIVGSGDTKILWSGFSKDGDNLTLRDVKTGAVEKEYTAKNLIPETTFLNTVVSEDEKFLLSERNDRTFVWEIDGDGTPRFEISAKIPNQKIKLLIVIAGKYLVFSIDKKLVVHDFAGNGSPLYELVSAKPNDTVNLGSITEDGKYIVVADDTKLSVLETAGNGKPIYEIARNSEKERFTLVKVMNEEKYLVVGRINKSEKQSETTEFYNIASGEKAFTIPAGFGYSLQFTPDKKHLYDEALGGTSVWNFAQSNLYKIPLKVQYPDDNANSPYNIEHTTLKPDGKFILKYGGKRTSLIDIETGKEVQTIFDADKAKFDKSKQVKNSKLGNARWSNDGKEVYAFNEGGFFSKSRTLSIWSLEK
ncbi:MAG: hypothetical protein H7Z37_08340 [Pyrinomonadaceae bacterium]|nr:hypothetical protein [Pyrinomonadaceae bacterium]